MARTGEPGAVLDTAVAGGAAATDWYRIVPGEDREEISPVTAARSIASDNIFTYDPGAEHSAAWRRIELREVGCLRLR